MPVDWSEWRPYLCNVNGKIASILVDLGLHATAPIPSKPCLLWVWVYFQSPRPDGLSDGKEAPTLYRIEDALNAQAASECRAVPCGRITTQGHREFYFYGETEEHLEKAVRTALLAFDGYKFWFGSKIDRLWTQYLTVLFPSSEDLQRIKNGDLLDLLVKKGDDLKTAREVRHWIYFRTAEGFASFNEAAAAAGFKIVADSPMNKEGSFGTIVACTQPIDQTAIDSTVITLLRLAQQHDGEYDGWETPVMAP